jgi:hypothetical protein
MRGVYNARYQITGVTAAKTLMYLTAPSGKVVEIISASVTNLDNDTNEQFEACLNTVSSLGTPTATSVTPDPTEAGDQAAGSTVKGNVTASEPTYGNAQFGREGASLLAGWFFDPLPEERPTVAPSATIGLRLLTAIASTGLNVNIRFREIG